MWLRFAAVVPFAVSLSASACAFDLADVRYAPTALEARSESEPTRVLEEDVRITRAPCGYRRTLRAGTRWTLAGSLPQGEVLRSPDQIFTVECSNVFEAYLVVRGRKLLGFYLPVQKGFVALREPIDLRFSASRRLQ
jgi:hypothetical protein